jgi:hypothetical protein
MTEIPTDDDQSGFVAKEPEHCSACFRLIHPGQTYYLTIEDTVLCADCALVEGVLRVREDLAIGVKSDRLLIQRGEAEVEVLPSDIPYLVDALAETAAPLRTRQTMTDSICLSLPSDSFSYSTRGTSM